ncbi:MAG: response regulator [Deltaproteobacteria bacterium]|nr:response regulator [Deltaproteobacteria bacterium]
MSAIPRRRNAPAPRHDNVVLFVDDEEGVLVALQHMVADSELTPIVASSGPEAIEVLKERGPVALVLSDYRMPGMTGVDLLREVHKLYPKTRRLILSGYAETYAVMEAINEGHVDRFLAKPWNDQKLLGALIEAVAHYNKEVENERMLAELAKRNQELERENEELEERVRISMVDVDSSQLFAAHQFLERLPYALFGFDANRHLLAINEQGRTFMNQPIPPSVGDHLQTVLPTSLVPVVDNAIANGEPRNGTIPEDGLTYDLEFVALGGNRCVMVLLRRS